MLLVGVVCVSHPYEVECRDAETVGVDGRHDSVCRRPCRK